jgi:Zn-dependent peptidase ImmA (M78 family)
LPRRLDWEILYNLKRRWGTSLKALVYRAHSVGVFRDTTYKRAMIRNLATSALANPLRSSSRPFVYARRRE